MSTQLKVAELTGAKLAEWVARAQGWRIENDEGEIVCWDPLGGVHSFGQFGYRPDLNWADGGPIIDIARIGLERPSNGQTVPLWRALADYTGKRKPNKFYGPEAKWGETALIAAMRAFVASKFGGTVPDEVES